MSIVLTRVDDRLVHGQVVIGWGRPLSLERIVLVDPEVRASSWEQDLYRMAAPPEIALEFLSPAEAAPRIRGWQAGRERVMVLLGSVAAAAELVRLSSPGSEGGIRRLNLGGIHAGAGRTERLRYLHLSEEETATLADLERRGLQITAQDVPTSRPIPLRELG
ncbi:MAG: PTS system mannose/fructose/N-acetylgalactosamine-transporter subunit IIB [Gemmatimonadales bacterium]